MEWKGEFLKTVCCDGELAVDALVEAINQSIPEKFYRYRAFNENNRNALSEGYEWMSYPDEYNDPFDARIFYDSDVLIDYVFNVEFLDRIGSDDLRQIRKIVGRDGIDPEAGRLDRQLREAATKKYGKLTASVKRLLRKVEEALSALPDKLDEELDSKVRKRSLICSFSTSHDNELMWAHYANSHKGYCLEYGHPEFSGNNGGIVLPVVYQDKPLDVTKFMKESYPHGRGASKAVLGSAMVKSQMWSYEDEWRYCQFSEEEDRYLKAFEPERLLLGCNATIEDREWLREICLQKGLPMYQMQRARDSFSILVGEKLA